MIAHAEQERPTGPSLDDRGPPPGERGEVRVSQVVGDRLCTRCAFNLCGQSVVREPVYRMLMVRCPECGTAAAMNEYPLLGKWGQRWRMAFLAGWLGVLIVGVTVTTAMLMGISRQTATEALEPLALLIAQKHKEHWEAVVAKEAEQGPPSSTAAAPGGTRNWVVDQAIAQPPNVYSYIDKGWWDEQDLPALILAKGGSTSVIKWKGWTRFLAAMPLPLIAGVLWAVFLMHVRRKRLPLLVLPMLAIAWLWGYWLQVQNTQGWWGSTAQQYAFEHLGGPVSAACTTVLCIGLLAGLLVGRPVARFVVRLYLPPRLRASVAYLWIADGLEPPGSGGKRAKVAVPAGTDGR